MKIDNSDYNWTFSRLTNLSLIYLFQNKDFHLEHIPPRPAQRKSQFPISGLVELEVFL